MDLIDTSLAIEGSRLTRAETAAVLEHGLATGTEPLPDALARKITPLRELDVRRIHERAGGDASREGAGCASRQPRPRTFGRTGPGTPGRGALAIPHPHAGR